MSWLRDIDRWFIDEVLPHAAAFRAKAAWLSDRDEAEDIVQEAYARAMAVADHRAIACPRAFVLTIVHNLALERLRRARVVPIHFMASLEPLDLADPAPDAFSVAAGRSDLALLMAQIERLPPQCARVIKLRKIHGLPPRAIAETLSISVSTVEKHIAKALALLTLARQDSDKHVEDLCPVPSIPPHRSQN